MATYPYKPCVPGTQRRPQPAGEESPTGIRQADWTPGSSMNRTALAAIPRVTRWLALLLIFAFPLCGRAATKKHAAKSLYNQAQAAEAADNYDAAYNLYEKALEKSPTDIRIRTALYRVRVTAASIHMSRGRKLEKAGNDQGALQEYLHASEIDPGNEAALQEINALRVKQGQADQGISPQEATQQMELNSMGSPVQLKPVSNEPLTLHMSEDAKVVYQAIGRAAGVNVLFDPDYTSKRIQVDLTNSSLMDALRIVGVISGTFWRPVTANTIFVAQDTTSKRKQLEDQAVQTFYLANAWQQNDLNDVQTALRNVLTNIKVYGLASQNALVVRGTPDELLLAQKLINDLDKARPEVVVDIAVMEVSKNWERTLGIQWPSSVGVQLQPPCASSTTANCNSTSTSTTTGTATTGTSVSPTLYNLAHLNSNDFAVTVGAATANLLLTDSNTRILQNPRLRATDMQKATMKIGERIPIATGSFQSGVGVAAGINPMAETQFQYIDVGVNIEVTPTVHFDNDVTLKLKIEITAQSGNVNISGLVEPIIAQKSSEEVVRLREGEANILSGILNQQVQQSWSGIPGLSSIPILKYLFGSMDHTITDDEVVFLLVPHVVRGADITAGNMRAIDTGSATNVELRRISADGPGANMPPQLQPVTTHAIAPPTQSGAASQQSFATVAGQSAASAAPNAMAQFKSSVSAATQPVPQTNLDVKPLPTTPPGAPATPSGGTPQVVPGAVPAAVAPGIQLHYLLNSPPPVTSGATFQVPIVVSGASDLTSSALRIQYDPARLALVNLSGGDLLSRDGQAVAESHSDDGPGNITLNISRPRTATGVNGAGVLAVLSFQAKAPGPTSIQITRAGGLNSKQQPVAAQGAQIDLQVK